MAAVGGTAYFDYDGTTLSGEGTWSVAIAPSTREAQAGLDGSVFHTTTPRPDSISGSIFVDATVSLAALEAIAGGVVITLELHNGKTAILRDAVRTGEPGPLDSSAGTYPVEFMGRGEWLEPGV